MASRNHTIDHLVDAFVKLKPDKERTDEEKAELGSKSKVKSDKPYIVKKDDYDDEDEDEDDEDDVDDRGFAARCRHCPPGTATDGYQCTAATLHTYCSLCARGIPTRPGIDVKCQVCTLTFCGQYFDVCGGVDRNHEFFRKLCDFELNEIPIDGFWRNASERLIFTNYLTANHKTVKQHVWCDYLIAGIRANTLKVTATHGFGASRTFKIAASTIPSAGILEIPIDVD
ncbi:hypothetical protein HK096_001966, partial [Nowakowskiella sp. JEL0078]